MAFPVDAARASTNGTVASVNKVCNLPAGIVSGDVLVLILRSAGADTHSTPAGWTAYRLNETDPSDDITSVWIRVADGTEGATVTVNGTGSVKFAAICWRITGGLAPNDTSLGATGTSTLPDPPAFTPLEGLDNHLWLWLGGWEGEQTSPPTGSPTNYVNPVGANSGVAGVVASNCRVAGASRQLNAATENPPSWTISVSDSWIAITAMVPPGAAPAGWGQLLDATRNRLIYVPR